MKRFIAILLCAGVLAGCEQAHQRSYWPKEMEPVAVQIARFDKAILNVRKDDAEQLREDIRALYATDREMMTEWVENIMGIPSEDTALLIQNLPMYLNDTVWGFRQTNALEQEVFEDISDLQKSLNQSFSRIKYLYPHYPVPTIYLIPSIFVSSLFSFDAEHFIAVGADMYLGSDYPVYDQVVYDYQKSGMRKECIPVDVVMAYLSEVLPYPDKQNRLLEQMLWRGRLMYLTAQIFDELPSYEVMGWTEEQWDWCVTNERAIWHHMMDQRDLFKTEHLVISNYLNDGPFTSEISQESPGRVGIWMGWRIVESYMEHNESVTLQELMSEGDAQKILDQSRYRP